MNIVTEMLVGNSGKPFWMIWAEDAQGTLAFIASADSESDASHKHKFAALNTPGEPLHPPASRFKAYKEAAQKLAKYGPWTDQISKVISPADALRLEAFWRMMPGYSSRSSAFHSLMLAGNGEATRTTHKVCK